MSPPMGLVTFLMTDVEASTNAWRDSSEDAAEAMGRQAQVIASCVAGGGGHRPVEQGEGDSTVSVFIDPAQAVACAVEAQLELQAEGLPAVRMGIHTGVAELVNDTTYGGTAIIRAARIRDLAPGGEIYLSEATAALVADESGVEVESMGEVVLKGFERATTVLRIEHPGLTRHEVSLNSADPTWPAFPTNLVGRRDEIDRVVALVEGAPLVTITGTGGSGKTRLAHAAATELADRFADGAAWVDLAAVSDGAQIDAAFATSLGLQVAPGADSAEQVARRVARFDGVIVVDNCEHLLTPVADLLTALTGRGVTARFLTTSREPLGVGGETTWRIPSLSISDELGGDAVALFVERARAVDPDFELDDTSAPLVARVCRRLDGIPLAIELAAARLRSLAIGDLAERLDDRFALLTSGTRGGLERQRTLLASVRWSYDSLDPDEQQLFRRLSVFSAPFTLNAAESVGSTRELSTFDVIDVLSRLVDKSLVRHAGGRYTMLETLRAFAADRAADDDELSDLRDRHLDWCVQRARSWGYPTNGNAGSTVEEQVIEGPDFATAVDWAVRTRPDALPVLMTLMQSVWIRTNQVRVAGALLEQFDRRLGRGSREWLGAVAPIVNSLALTGPDWEDAARSGLEEHPDLDPMWAARLEAGLHALGVMMGQAAAHDGLRRASERSAAAGDQWGALAALTYEAGLLASRAETARLRKTLSWVDNQEGLDTANWAGLTIARALVAVADGRLDEARVHLADASTIGVVSLVVTSLAITLGDQQLAEKVERELDLPNGEVLPFSGVWARCASAILRADWDSARQGLVDWIEAGAGTFSVGTAGARLAELELHFGDPDGAEARLAATRESIQEGTLPTEGITLDVVEVVVAVHRGDAKRAVRAAHRALDKATEADDMRLAATYGLRALALAQEADGRDPAEYSRVLGAADGFCEPRNYAWRGPVFDEALEQLRQRVDEDAYNEGRATPVWSMVEELSEGRAPTSRATHGWESLTPAEERVVALVGQGDTNPQIAETLHVSVSTVKTHLVHVYQKLGIDTRAGLAAAAVTRKLVVEG